jgi:two-component system response regulator DesR
MASGTSAPVKVLVVDDQEDIRFLLRVLIRKANEGLEATWEAASGTEALAIWGEHRPEAIILDQNMPGPLGIEVARQILRDDPERIILLLSAVLTPDLIAQASALGVKRCVGKEHISEVAEMLRDLVRAA